jgi:hypothetical protein
LKFLSLTLHLCLKQWKIIITIRSKKTLQHTGRKQKHTKHTTIYTMIKKWTKRTWTNMINEKAIKAANFLLSTYFLIMLDNLLLSLSLHFTQLRFTPLYYTFRHLASYHLNCTQLHFTTLSFGLTPVKFPTAQFHLTSLHFTSLHFIALLDDFRHIYILFISPRL